MTDVYTKLAELERRLAWLERFEVYTNGYEDLIPLPVTANKGVAAPPDVTGYNGGTLAAMEFPNNAVKAYYSGWQLPHGWDLGSAVYPHLHLFVPAGTTGDIKFVMYYSWVNINEEEGAEANVYGIRTIASGAVNNGNAMLDIDSATIDATGKTMSSILMARFVRDPADAADTFGASVWLKSIDMHIMYEGFGSRTVSAK